MASDQEIHILNDALSDRKLELIIFPTEHCNFRCTYCYEDFSVGKMAAEIVEGLKNLIDNRAEDLSSLYISWFGGEPLIAYDIVLDINHYAQRIAAQRPANRPLHLHIGMTTNGYLLDAEKLGALHKSGLREYQISFDGFGPGHDATRKRADGAATFEKIWHNILTFNAMRANGYLAGSSILLRLHVHPTNMGSIGTFADLVAEHLNPEWFSIFIKNVGHYGGPNDKDFAVFDPLEHEFGETREKLAHILEAFLQPSADALATHVCYAAKANAFTIRADGGIGKCTVALNSQSNKIGQLTRDGRMALNGPATANWLYALQTMAAEDLACPAVRLPRL